MAERNGFHGLMDAAAHGPSYLGSDRGALLSRWILGLLWRGTERQGVWTCYSNGDCCFPPSVQHVGLWAYPCLGPWVQSPTQDNRATKQGGKQQKETLMSTHTQHTAQYQVLSLSAGPIRRAKADLSGLQHHRPSLVHLLPRSLCPPNTLCLQSCSLRNSARVACPVSPPRSPFAGQLRGALEAPFTPHSRSGLPFPCLDVLVT